MRVPFHQCGLCESPLSYHGNYAGTLCHTMFSIISENVRQWETDSQKKVPSGEFTHERHWCHLIKTSWNSCLTSFHCLQNEFINETSFIWHKSHIKRNFVPNIVCGKMNNVRLLLHLSFYTPWMSVWLLKIQSRLFTQCIRMRLKLHVFVSQSLGKITKRNPYGRTNLVFILSQAAENIQSDLPHNSPEDL